MSSPAPINRTMTATEWGLLVILSSLWGSSFYFVAIAVRELPPFTIVLGRVALTAIILNLAFVVRGMALPSGRDAWIAFFVMSLLNNVIPFSLLIWGQKHVPSGVAAIINATSPLFTVLVAHMVTHDEKMTIGRVLGISIGLAGVAVMIGTAALQSFSVDIVGQLACLGASIAFAVSSLYGRRFSRMGVKPIVSTAGLMTASTFVLLPLVLAFDQPWTLPAPSMEAVVSVLALGLSSTLLGYLIYFRILAAAGATNLMLVNFLVPITAVLLGVAFLGEYLAPKHIFGMILIAAGLAAIDGRLARALRRQRAPDR